MTLPHATLRVAALHHYPVKSLGGGQQDSALVTRRGLAGDRRWLVTTPEGRFVTRRELPAMALIVAGHRSGALALHHVDGASLLVAEPDASTLRQTVTVWGDRIEALAAGAEADAWLSACLGRPLRLFHMDASSQRSVDPAYGAAGDEVSFADGFPLLVTTVESLAALNARLDSAITMARFRPNIVLEGADTAFAEDDWQALRIGDLRLRVVKPCTRCVITTQDPDTGTAEGMEPLRTLRAMGRVWNRQPIFGQNAIPDGEGTIAVGDVVTVELRA